MAESNQQANGGDMPRRNHGQPMFQEPGQTKPWILIFPETPTITS
jgi:hypothetical protein